MLLACARAISRDYHPNGKHIAKVFGEVLVGTAVFVPKGQAGVELCD
jgi:hypothetical protein